MYFVTRGYIVKVKAIVLDGDYTLRTVIKDGFLVYNRIDSVDIMCVIYAGNYKRRASGTWTWI
jgi:hypothetical protein